MERRDARRPNVERAHALRASNRKAPETMASARTGLRKDLPGGFRAFRGWFVGAGPKTDPQDGRPGTQPGNAAACFTQVAICASSRSSSWMSIQRAFLSVPPGGTGRIDVPRKKVTLT